MAELTLQKIDESGDALTYAAADVAGDTFNTRNGAFVHIVNGDASPHTLTVAPVTTPVNTPEAGDLVVPSIAVVVAAGTDRMVKFPPAYQALGVVSLTYDAVTSVTVAALYVG